MTSPRRLARLPFVLAALVLALAGCKQGEGEYCQIDDDCAGGLVCAPLTDTCEQSAGPGIDGGIDAPPIDAPPIDAEEPDAEPDAAPDAEPDAEPEPE